MQPPEYETPVPVSLKLRKNYYRMYLFLINRNIKLHAIIFSSRYTAIIFYRWVDSIKFENDGRTGISI